MDYKGKVKEHQQMLMSLQWMYKEERGIADGTICAQCPTEQSSLNAPPRREEELTLALGCCPVSGGIFSLF